MNNIHSKPRQVDKILNYLKLYGNITSLEALEQFGIMRTASRISELRKTGYNIKTETVKSKNRFGETVHFGKYILEDKNENCSTRS